MLSKKADRILQQIQPEGIADIAEVYESFRPPFLENAYSGREGFQLVVVVRHKADSPRKWVLVFHLLSSSNSGAYPVPVIIRGRVSFSKRTRPP